MNNKTGASKRKKDIVLGRIKDLREWEKLTQAEFAESIEVSPNTISRIEREEMSLSSDIALKIADRHGISLDWLFGRGEEILSPERQEKAKEAFSCIDEQEVYNEEKPKVIKLSVCNNHSDMNK